MGETVRRAQNCLRIFKLSKLVNGKGIHSGSKHLSHGLNSIEPRREGGWESLTHLQLEAKIERQVANTSFANH